MLLYIILRADQTNIVGAGVFRYDILLTKIHHKQITSWVKNQLLSNIIFQKGSEVQEIIHIFIIFCRFNLSYSLCKINLLFLQLIGDLFWVMVHFLSHNCFKYLL